MFSRVYSIFLFALFALPLLAAASAIPRDGQCSTGAIQCCNETQSSTNLSNPVTALLGLLGVVVGDITALVGLNCSPISVIGVGGNSCTAQPVCCTNNSFNGLIALGCTPININL
ncbi:fungal hydrophobin-domain-containing protein [Cyathus striatus]|nr:fungal hydrophobin-domain-containing protein [Cyathus striatus]